MNTDEVIKLLMETDNDDDDDYYMELRSLNCQKIVCCVIWHGSIFCLQYNNVIVYTRILVVAESGSPGTTRILVVSSQRVIIIILLKL